MRKIFRLLCAAILAAAPLAAHAAAPLNRAGFWTLEAKEGASCLATLKVKGGHSFLLLGTAGHLAFGALSEQPLARGKRGVIATEAYSFDFDPLYGEKGQFLYTMRDLDAREQAALRLARVIRLSVDGQPVLEAPVEATGLDGVLDDVVACSKGETGWWGKGAAGLTPAKADPPAKSAPASPPPAKPSERVFNKEGFWSVAAARDPGVCSALARQDNDAGLVLVARGREMTFGVGWPKAIPHGRKGVLEADGLRFDFSPQYDGDDYFSADKMLDSQTLFVLRRAKGLTVTVDGREMLSMQLEGTGLDGVVPALFACANGESGWWGTGARLR